VAALPTRSAPPTALDRWLVRRVLAARGNPPVEIVLWNGERIRASREPTAARLAFRDRALLRELLLHGEVAFGDAYAGGRLEVEGDLVRLLEAAFAASDRTPRWARAAARLAAWRPRGASRRRAREYIHHHYDVGNDFYRLWLDEQMQYTCAYFRTPAATLEEAQRAKMDHVCRKLDLRPGESVLEAGCGWGTFAMHMAERYGVRVRAVNISEEQLAWAREEAARRGLGDRVEFCLEDYRDVRGRYDVFVSVGMLEHVGKAHYSTLGRVIDRSLGADGRGLLHFIGRARPSPFSPFMERRVFPGAYPPSLREMLLALEPWGFAVQDVENLRRHYARTLAHWLERFEKAADAIRDERLLRTWRLYLAGTMMSFRVGWAHLFQVLFARPGSDRLPATRDPLYAQA
jgi:cyclopropane-fatty-acyl-phospholipid synthase